MQADADETEESRLQRLVSGLVTCPDLATLLKETLNAALTLLGADMGNVQLLDKRRNVLEIVAHSGDYPQEFLDYFRVTGRGDGSACGRALSRQEYVIIEDVETDPEFAPHRAIAAVAGFRGVQSMPLIDRRGHVLGVLSTHFRKPRRPTPHQLRELDLYIRLATAFIEQAMSGKRPA